MKYAQIPNVSNPISRIVLGTGFVTQGADPDSYYDVMDAAFEAGINAIDSGREYADGYSDTCIGKWMARKENRKDIVLISKGCHHNAWRKRVTPFDLSADIFDSLAALQTDYIDIYMLHRDDPDVPVGSMVEALNEHFEAGRIKAFGASNWEYQRIKEANEYACSHGLQSFTVASQHFSLGVQISDPWGGGCVSLTGPSQQKAREWYKKVNMPLLAYSSLSMGMFSGRATKSNFMQLLKDGVLHEACGRAYGSTENLERLQRVTDLAKEKNVSVAVISLAYVLNFQETSGIETFALVGSENPEEIKSSATAADLVLSKKEMEWLNLERESRY